MRQLMRIAWATLGRIITRVVAERGAAVGPLANLRRIGIDEICYRKGQRYLTMVADHVSDRLVCAAPGRDKPTLRKFFDLLGEDRCNEIRLVSADAATWIADVVAERCKSATLCLDPFHIVAWATDALDEVRRGVCKRRPPRRAEGGGQDLKGARYALWKNTADLTERGQAKLADIRRTNDRPYRAYLMKEQLRMVFHQDSPAAALALLERWLAWACRSRIPVFVKLPRKIRHHRGGIQAALSHGLSNARVESVNTKIRLITPPGVRVPLSRGADRVGDAVLGWAVPPLPGRA